MSAPSDKIAKFLVIFIVSIFLFKNALGSGLFEPKSHKGKGYYVKVPEGWQMVKKEKGVVYPQGVEVAMFVPRGINVKKKDPDVFITMFTKKLTTPIWIEDEWPDILRSLAETGYKIMDKGELKLDDKISPWVVYHDSRTPALVLAFYIVTDSGVFYKMEYTAHPDKFNQNRPAFEELKNSFKFRFSLY